MGDVFGLPLVVDGLNQEDGQWRRHQVQDRPGNNVVSPPVDGGYGVEQGEDDPDDPAEQRPDPRGCRAKSAGAAQVEDDGGEGPHGHDPFQADVDDPGVFTEGPAQ